MRIPDCHRFSLTTRRWTFGFFLSPLNLVPWLFIGRSTVKNRALVVPGVSGVARNKGEKTSMDHLPGKIRSMVSTPTRTINYTRRKTVSIICLVLIYTVLGCGGGGGPSSTNIPPVADAGEGRVVNAGEAVILNGSASIDPDGQIVSYQWVPIDTMPVELTGADTVSPSFVAPVTDNRTILVFRLIIQDNSGAQSSATVTITVNIPPTADAGPDQFAYGDSPVDLNGTAEDGDGLIISHLWEQTAGTEVVLSGATAPTLSFIAPSTTGTLTFRYTATDNEGAQNFAIVSVHVSQVLYSDSFDFSSSLLDWRVIDNSGKPSSWSVNSGGLYQQNNVDVDAFIESYHTGTFAYLHDTVFPPRAAFRFSVDITPRTNSNGLRQGNDIGIMFPYAAVDDYYRLTMNARYGFTRFEKRQGTGFITLAVNSIGYLDDEQINITVEVNGDTIVILIDGEPLFAESNLEISPGTVALYCQDEAIFDNVVIAENSLQPMVAISSPLAYSVGLNPVLAAEAVVLNQPAGGSVLFSLDGGIEIESTPSDNRYSAQFLGVGQGEHEIAAILKAADNAELNRDINSAVGVVGRYIIAVGDSITNGFGDENPFNNNSLDGRIVARQGFAAQLNDLLTHATGLPHIVFNEGIGGDRSEHLDVDRIDSILERHPGADTMLLLIGTNDVWANIPVNDFAMHVSNIVNVARFEVNQVSIARILPFYNAQQEILNSRVAIFNQRIDQIVAEDLSANFFLGPDFYQLFEGQSTVLYGLDGVHPNDAGYQAMAGAWRDSLVSHEP
jgi:lysophospholipase L1-like esterase